jgi:hypothetical protein
MGRPGGWLCCVMAASMLSLPTVAEAATARDSTVVHIRVGAGFDAHSDLLASPFRQHGTGLDGDLALVHDGFQVTLTGGTDRSSSRIASATGGFEDLWTLSADVRWARGVASFGNHTSLELGADVGGLVFGRRHQYSPGYREYFDDVAFPLSLSVGLGHDLGARGLLDERLDVGLLTVMLRSPFAGARTLARAWWTGPGSVQVLRHRLRLSVRMSPHVRVFLTHGLTFLATDRERPLRMVRQDVSVGVTLYRGGGARP